VPWWDWADCVEDSSQTRKDRNKPGNAVSMIHTATDAMAAPTEMSPTMAVIVRIAYLNRW
jgi:hypothetical protein